MYSMSGTATEKKRKGDQVDGKMHKTKHLHLEDDSPPQLHTRIQNISKSPFKLKTKDFFLPTLYQLGNSVSEIKSHYCPEGEVCVAPRYLPIHLSGIRDKILHLLKDEKNGLLTRTNVLLPGSSDKDTNVSGDAFIFITHTLAVPLNIHVPSLPEGHICDIIILCVKQPPFLLTIVEKETHAAKRYNVTIARGVTTSLNKFLVEDFSAVFGFFTSSSLDDTDIFTSKLVQRAGLCSSFVPLDSLLVDKEKYSKVLTAFWASVAQADSVSLTSGVQDKTSVNFLTKEQCIVLIENINTKNVLVMAQRNTGSTTLMLEVARRFQLLGPTKLIFKHDTDLTLYRSLEGIDTTCLGSSDSSSVGETIETVISETILPVHFRALHEVRVWTFCSDFIRPKLLNSLVESLSRYQFLLLVGSPGEGKSVLGVLLLEHYKTIGKKIKVLDSIEELLEASKDVGDIFVLIDDAFGRLRCTFQLTKEIEYAFERIQSKINIKVLLTSRTDVFRHAFPQLGKFQSQFDGDKMFNLSDEATRDNKRQMLDKYLLDYNKYLPENVKEEIIQQPTFHGFPHSCQMYTALQIDAKNAMKFYENPLSYQAEMIQHFLEDTTKKSLLYLLMAYRGSFPAEILNELSNKSRAILSHLGHTDMPKKALMLKAAEAMLGVVLTEVDGTISFSHPSLFEVTAHVIAQCDIAFALEHGPIELFEETPKGTEKDAKKFSICVQPETEEFQKLAGRFSRELTKCQFQAICQHALLRNQSFAHSVVEQLHKSQLEEEDMNKLFYWSTSNNSYVLIKELMSKYKCSQQMIHSAVTGCCRWGNVLALEYTVQNTQLKGRDIDDITESGVPCVIVAANQNHKLVLMSLISHDINTKAGDSRKGATALHWACAAGHEEVAHILIKHIAVDAESNGGVAPLFVAAENGHRPLVDFLIQKGADVNKQIQSRLVSLTRRRIEGHASVKQLTVSDEGFTALHVASYEGHVEVVKTLLDAGADPTIRAEEGLPVAFAARSNQMEIFRIFLLEKTLKMEDILDAAYENGQSEMMSAALLSDRSEANEACKAAHFGNLSQLQCMTNDQYGIRTHELTCLHLAAQAGHVDIVNILVKESRELLHVRSRQGFTALHGAAITGKTEVVLELLDKGAHVNDQCKARITALHFASIHGHKETVKVLIDYGADINIPGYRNWTPLHMATIHNRPEVVKYLIERKANVEALSVDLGPPLVFAAYRNHTEIIDILIDRGHATINPTGRTSVPLLAAALMGTAESVQYIINKGADINGFNAFGVNALHAAVFMSSTEVIKCLIKNGVHIDQPMFAGLSEEEKHFAKNFVYEWCKDTPGKDVNLTRYDGGTPLHIAVDMNNAEIVQLLLEAGARIDLVNQINETPVKIAHGKGSTVLIKLLESKMKN